MFSLLPLPVTPIRPANAALPPPDPAPRSQPIAAPIPGNKTELGDPRLIVAGPEPAVLSPLLATQADAKTGPSPSYGAAEPARSTTPADVQIRGTAMWALVQEQATPPAQNDVPRAVQAQAQSDELSVAMALASKARAQAKQDGFFDALTQSPKSKTADTPPASLLRDYVPRDPAPEPKMALTL